MGNTDSKSDRWALIPAAIIADIITNFVQICLYVTRTYTSGGLPF